MIELKAINLHWLGNSDAEEERDLCAHSSVFLRIRDKIVSDENSGDWAVSASAYYLLKTLLENHNGKEEPQLLPCCGASMFATGKTGKELVIIGCPNGINWTITHKQNKVVHKFDDGEMIETDAKEWRKAVCNFSDEVMNFYQESLPKKFSDYEDERGFKLFIHEWKKLRAEALE